MTRILEIELEEFLLTDLNCGHHQSEASQWRHRPPDFGVCGLVLMKKITKQNILTKQHRESSHHTV